MGKSAQIFMIKKAPNFSLTSSFLEECMYVVKEKTIHKYIIDDIEIFILILMKKIVVKKILMKKIKFLFHIKMATKYCQKHKERLRKKAHER